MEFDDNIPTDPDLNDFDIDDLIPLEFPPDDLHELHSDGHSDDIEALALVEEERVQHFIQSRQIIHQPNLDRIPELRGTWRSSSLPPPDSPTPSRPRRIARPNPPLHRPSILSSPPHHNLLQAPESPTPVRPSTPISQIRRASPQIFNGVTANMNPFEEVSDDEDAMMVDEAENFLNFKPTLSQTLEQPPKAAPAQPSTSGARDPFGEVVLNGRTRSPTSPAPTSQPNGGLYAEFVGIKEATKIASSSACPFEEDSDSEDAPPSDIIGTLGVNSQKRPLETESEQMPPRKRVVLTPPPAWPGPDKAVSHRIEIDMRARLEERAAQTDPLPQRKVVGSFKIRKSDGQEFDTPLYVARHKQKKNEPPRESGRNAAGRTTFYGVDIHTLMKDAQAEIALEAMKPRDAPAPDAIEIDHIPSKHKALLWTEKYRAKRFTELVGDERTHRQVMRWLKSWDPIVFPSGKPVQQKPDDPEIKRKKILLITGPPGLGKTTLAHVAAKQAGYEPSEINASEARNRDVVNGRLRDMVSNEGVKMGTGKRGVAKPVCLIVDEIDGVEGNAESGFTGALVNLLALDHTNSQRAGQNPTNRKKKNRKKDEFRLYRPIIAVCNDLYAPCLKALRPLCEVVYMHKPPVNLISNRMKWVFQQEKIDAEDGAVRRLVELACGGEGGKGGGSGGDLRGALVGGEWIASRLRNLCLNSTGGSKAKLTRQLVEEEMGGGYGGVDGGGQGKGGVREVVEKVFCAEKTKKSRKEPVKKGWQMEELRRSVETCGEFDKVMSDCHATFPERPYHDDNFLTKPCTAYEWLNFYDHISSRVWEKQDYELTPYLTQPILAFRTLFASSSQHSGQISFGMKKDFKDNEEEEPPAPFTGTKADFDAREALKANKTLIQSLHSNLLSVRTLLCFKSEASVATELAPYLTRILSPQVTPVVVTNATGRIASVRKESEKKLVSRSVGVMLSLGLEFEKIQIEDGPNRVEYAYRLEPPIDVLANYPTFTSTTDPNAAPVPVRYAIRQVLHQECEKEKILQKQLLRQARGLAISADLPQTKSVSAKVTEIMLDREAGVKRDFFGRVVKPTDEFGAKKTVRKEKVVKLDNPVWVTFNEGFSNAVRKNIGLEELMKGFF